MPSSEHGGAHSTEQLQHSIWKIEGFVILDLCHWNLFCKVFGVIKRVWAAEELVRNILLLSSPPLVLLLKAGEETAAECCSADSSLVSKSNFS